MNVKQLALLAVMGVTLCWAGLVARPTAAQQQGQENLLLNPSFEQGHHKQDNAPELSVPDGWKLHYVDGTTFPGSTGVAYRPESVVWYIEDAPLNERELFFRDGVYAVKIFKSWAAIYAALSQDVSGLTPGRSYRLVAPIYVDIVEFYNDGKKVAPGNLDIGQVRLGSSPVGASWRDEAAIKYSGWWTAANTNPFYLAYPVFVHDFTATSDKMTVWVEFASKYPYQNNAFFMDAFGLYTLNGGPAPAGNSGGQSAAPALPLPTLTPGPTPTPRADGAIVHVVQPGDSFWTIAIRYAPALGMTPEEAFPHIRDINNNPQFISVGQELFIALPNTTAVAAAPTAETQAEATAAADEQPTEAAPQVGSEAEPTPVPTAAAPLGTICVSVYSDNNSNGAREASSEGLLADAAITLSQAGSTVATYVSDGINEPYCFEGLEADTYQVQIFPPAGYTVTSSDNWAIALTNGNVVPVEFGTQLSTAQVAVADTNTAVAETAVEPTAEPAAAAASEAGGLFSNVGTLVIGAAVVLVLLAGIGVVLLRRG